MSDAAEAGRGARRARRQPPAEAPRSLRDRADHARPPAADTPPAATADAPPRRRAATDGARRPRSRRPRRRQAPEAPRRRTHRAGGEGARSQGRAADAPRPSRAAEGGAEARAVVHRRSLRQHADVGDRRRRAGRAGRHRGASIAARRRKTTKFEDSIISGTDIKTNTVFGSTGGGVVNTGDNSLASDFSREGLGNIDTDEVDPIAEAEVYLAYGRDAQAEEILKDALKKDPQRQEIYLKLLEIHAQHNKPSAFETVAERALFGLGRPGRSLAEGDGARAGSSIRTIRCSPKAGSAAAFAAVGAASRRRLRLAPMPRAEPTPPRRGSSVVRGCRRHQAEPRRRQARSTSRSTTRFRCRRRRRSADAKTPAAILAGAARAGRQVDRAAARRGGCRGRRRPRDARDRRKRAAPVVTLPRARIGPEVRSRLPSRRAVEARSADARSARARARRNRLRPSPSRRGRAPRVRRRRSSRARRRRSSSTSSTSRSIRSARPSRIRRRRCSTASGTTRRPSSTSPRPIRRWATSKVRAKSCRKCCTKATTSRKPKRRRCCRSSA